MVDRNGSRRLLYNVTRVLATFGFSLGAIMLIKRLMDERVQEALNDREVRHFDELCKVGDVVRFMTGVWGHIVDKGWRWDEIRDATPLDYLHPRYPHPLRLSIGAVGWLTVNVHEDGTIKPLYALAAVPSEGGGHNRHVKLPDAYRTWDNCGPPGLFVFLQGWLDEYAVRTAEAATAVTAQLGATDDSDSGA